MQIYFEEVRLKNSVFYLLPPTFTHTYTQTTKPGFSNSQVQIIVFIIKNWNQKNGITPKLFKQHKLDNNPTSSSTVSNLH